MERDYMVLYRSSNGKTIVDMAKECKCSSGIIRMLEEDIRNVTHPNIAKRIKEKYCLTDAQLEMMIPENYRKSSPKYDPDHFKIFPISYDRPKQNIEVVV